MKELLKILFGTLRVRHFELLRTYSICLFIFIVTCASTIEFSIASDVPNIDVSEVFVPFGWMGDGEYGSRYIVFERANNNESHNPSTSMKIRYTFGPKRWGGIYWQNKPDNWGNRPGNDYSKKNFSRITFWAKGEKGNEVIEFKAGGINAPRNRYSDSFDVSTGRVTLSNNWKEYEIVIKGLDLTSVIGGFCWVASKDYNSSESISFYIGDILYK